MNNETSVGRGPSSRLVRSTKFRATDIRVYRNDVNLHVRKLY